MIFRKTVSEFIANAKTSNLPVGTIARFEGFTTSGDGGAADWELTAVTGTASQTPAQLGNALLNDASGRQWKLVGDTVSFVQLGADKLKVADSKAAMQAAFDSGKFVWQVGGDFLFDSQIKIPDNTKAMFKGATLYKNYGGSGTVPGIVNSNWSVGSNSNIQIEGLSVDQSENNINKRGYIVQFVDVEGLRLHKFKARATAEYASGAVGMWALYICGKDVTISDPDVDMRNGGLFADGMHFGYLENATITGGQVFGGDDALAFYYPSSATAQAGPNKTSKNITVSGVRLASKTANIIRIGAASSQSEGVDAGDMCAFQNLHISNIIDCGEQSREANTITITDLRAAGVSSVIHNNITIDGVKRLDGIATTANYIQIQGSPSALDVANIGIKNIGKVTIANFDYKLTSSKRFLTGGCVESLTFVGGGVNRDAIVTTALIDFRQCNNLTFDNFNITTGAATSSGTSMTLQYIKNFKIINGCDWSGGGSEYAMCNIDTNATQDTNVTLGAGCKIHGSTRLFLNNDATTPLASLRNQADLYDATTKLSPNMLTFARGYNLSPTYGAGTA